MNQHFVLITTFSLFGAIIGLFGCENARNTDQICKNNPELCADLHEDGWCLYEKGDVIRNRYELKLANPASDKQIYQQLISLEKYSECIELASGVKHYLNPNRTLDRKQAFAVSVQNLEQLREYTKDNMAPYLVYYRWIRFNDSEAFDTLLNYYQHGQIKDSEILAQLGAYFVRRDANEAKQIYRYLLQNETTIDPNWLLAIASIYRYEENKQLEYFYTKANTLISENKSDHDSLVQLINNDKALELQLDLEVANFIIAIDEQTLTEDLLAKYLP